VAAVVVVAVVAGKRSDILLKHDIVPFARLDNGIGIYRFQYNGNDHTTSVGVMAQEVAKIVPSAVSRGDDGYLRVNYDQIGIKFMTWDRKAQTDATSGLAQ
jgi:Chaperone of endosialidase